MTGQTVAEVMAGQTVADKLWEADIIMTKNRVFRLLKQIAVYFLLVTHDYGHNDINH